MAERRVTKVSYNGKRVKVLYQLPREGTDEPDEFALVCNDRPTLALRFALDALRHHVAAICQLPPKYCEVMEIRGASFSFAGEDEVMGAVITALKRLPTTRAPLVLNTPYLASAPMSQADDAPLLSPAAREALEELAEQGLAYVDGAREQGDLFAKVATDPGVVNAIANLAPKPGSGIDSVTLSSGDTEVTLRQGDGERIRRSLEVVR